MADELVRSVLRFADDDALAERMQAFYADVDARVTDLGSTCQNRGDCCRFDAYGHRLYVTTVELAYFVRGLRDAWRSPDDGSLCPFHVKGLCVARSHRPMGCRVFFCDPATQTQQHAEYERQLAELKAISEAFGIDYRYVEWLSALRSIAPTVADVISDATADTLISQPLTRPPEL
jgi:Fe-S-cluster containining protein